MNEAQKLNAENAEAQREEGPLTSAEVLAEIIPFAHPELFAKRASSDPLPPLFQRQAKFLPGGEIYK